MRLYEIKDDTPSEKVSDMIEVLKANDVKHIDDMATFDIIEILKTGKDRNGQPFTNQDLRDFVKYYAQFPNKVKIPLSNLTLVK